MRIAVTGATGFLGEALCKALEDEGHELYRFSSSNQNLRSEIELPPCDVLYHTGGNSKVYLAKQNPILDFEINAYGTIKLMEAVVKAGIPKVIFTSSNSVYKDLIVEDEDSQVGNNDYGKFYGLSKLIADLYVKEYAEFYGFDYVILRPSNFYGPGMVKNVIIDVIKGYLEGKTIRIGFTFDSEIDFIYIDDLVSGHIHALGLRSGIFNLCHGASTRIGELLKIIEANFENRIDVLEGENQIIIRQGNEKLRATGWEPAVDIRTGISITADYFKRRS